jgi:hypothetical protein
LTALWWGVWLLAIFFVLDEIRGWRFRLSAIVTRLVSERLMQAAEAAVTLAATKRGGSSS